MTLVAENGARRAAGFAPLFFVLAKMAKVAKRILLTIMDFLAIFAIFAIFAMLFFSCIRQVCHLGSPKILIFGESGGTSCLFIKRSGINHCTLVAERDR